MNTGFDATQQYHKLLESIVKNGTWKQNRTGIKTIFLPGLFYQVDVSNYFPAVTTKQLAFRAVVGELIGFLNGCDNAHAFRNLGCNIWDKNANENKDWLSSEFRFGKDDLGRIYGVQWRSWYGADNQTHDQVGAVLDKLKSDPLDRRMIVNAWKVDEIANKQMALPPCHIMHQLIYEPETDKLHLLMYQRSCDMFLGVPFNIASYGLLLTLYAKHAGMKAGTLSITFADAHIYENHQSQVNEQLTRVPYVEPNLYIKDCNTVNFDMMNIKPADIELLNYTHHPKITAEMAV